MDEAALYNRIRLTYPSLTNEQCVELVRKVVGIPEGVRDWRRGTNVRERLPVGTPLATFMDREGRPSEYYDAHEGVGAPGNNTTHAAILAGYTDKGILVAEQYVGSGGPHLREYKYGDPRGGEKAAENYYSINTASGAPAGEANPLKGGAPSAPIQTASNDAGEASQYGYGIGARPAVRNAPSSAPPQDGGHPHAGLLARRATIGKGLRPRGGSAPAQIAEGRFQPQINPADDHEDSGGDISISGSAAASGASGLALRYSSTLMLSVRGMRDGGPRVPVFAPMFAGHRAKAGQYNRIISERSGRQSEQPSADINYYDGQTPTVHRGGTGAARAPVMAAADRASSRSHTEAAMKAAGHPSTPSPQSASKPKISSKEMGRLLQSVDEVGDPEGKRYAHEEWERPAFSYKGDDEQWFPPQQYQKLDDLLEPHPPKGKKPVPGIDTEPPEGLDRKGRTGGWDIWGGPGGRTPEPENKPGQRYPDKWKPGGTDI
jgi:hypothetical protein